MLHAFEDMARTNPRQLCFTAVDAAGRESRFTYHQARLYGSALAQVLRAEGVARGNYVSVEMPNGAGWPLLLLAAAYGNFGLVGMDPHLTVADRTARYAEIESVPNTDISFTVNLNNITELMTRARALIDGEGMPGQSGFSGANGRHVGLRASLSSGPSQGSYLGATRDVTKLPPSQLRRYSSDSEESMVHFADHAKYLFDASKPAVVLFTAGVSGKSKPVCLSWKHLTAAAKALNTLVSKQGRGVWQAVLPCYRVMGLQVIVRSLCNRSSFVIYEYFDPARLLTDVDRLGATHIAVDDAMISEFLLCPNQGALRRYSCMLLGGSALSADVAAQCRAQHMSVYAGYGTTETAGHIAIGLMDDRFDGSLRLLPGVEVRIEDAAPNGFGKLLVKGPSVCDRYFGMRTPVTVNGYLATGDTAKSRNNCITVHGRTDDMFLCGGTNVYPDEIRQLLLDCSGVSDAYVFGAPDVLLGACPIAFVERNDRGMQNRPSARRFARKVRQRLEGSLAAASMPKHIFCLDSFPRTSVGKIDGALLEQCYQERLEVSRVVLHRVVVPLVAPTLIGGRMRTERESLLVEVIDYAGRTGISECVAFSSDIAGFEILRNAEEYLSSVLAPHVIGQAFLHPGEVTACLMECPDAPYRQRSCGALEPAFWDLYGKISNLAFWQLIGGKAALAQGTQCRVRAGALVGLSNVQETVEQVWRCAEAGYSCVTIEVRPGMAFERVRAVRQVFPDLMITLDAKQSFTEKTMDELRKLDTTDVSWIEEPLSFVGMGALSSKQRLQKLARLQQTLKIPICLDESIATLQEAYMALEYPNLRYMVARIGEFGGVRPTLDFIRQAHMRGVHVWMGGMFDLGISRRMHAAFQTLSSVEDAGNTGSVLRQFVSDVADPPHTVERGLVTLNRRNDPFGIGCHIDSANVSHYLIHSITIE
ncbi:MAG: AMP-binding protein [Eggerthellales bacterium]|nr:AMP-binding protein [Eggerthellales bacterium]